jgi:hypothetical protein
MLPNGQTGGILSLVARWTTNELTLGIIEGRLALSPSNPELR